MIALYLLLGVIAVLFLVLILALFIPVKVKLKLSGKLEVFVLVLGIRIFSNEEKPQKKRKKTLKKAKKSEKKQPENKKKDNPFIRSVKEKGLLNTLEFYRSVVKAALSGIGFFLRRIKIRKFTLDITVATDNAAKTAIEYGEVCTAVYPAISFVASKINFKPQRIDISTNFDATAPEVYFYTEVSSNLLSVVMAAANGYKKYRRLKKESENSERK